MTDVQICNLALARLGDARITTLADATAQAQYCALFYAQTVQELQTEADWQFCRKLASIAADGTAPAFGYAARYALPADCLRVLRINGVDEDENFGKWEIVGGYIHTGLTGPISLDYLANVTTTTAFPPVFIEILTAKLAAHLAMPLTGSSDLFATMTKLFAELFKRPSVRALVVTQAKERAAATASNEELCRQAILRIGTAEQMGPSTQAMLLAQSLLPQVRDSLLLAGSWTWASKSATLTADALAPEFKWANRYALPSDCLRVFRVNDTTSSSTEPAWEVQGGYLLTDEESDAPDWVAGRVYAAGNAVTLAGATGPAWATGTAYAAGFVAASGGASYRCVTAHTSGTFATDLAAGKWAAWTGTTYRCATAHTAGTFATDLAAGKWAAWTKSVLAVEYIAKETDPTKFDSLFADLLATTLAARLAVPLADDPNKAKLLAGEAEALLKNAAMRRDSTKRRARIAPAWQNSKLVAARHA